MILADLPHADYIDTAIRQVPALFVFAGTMIYLARIFTKHMDNASSAFGECAERFERREQARDVIDDKRAVAIATLGESCHDVQREAYGVMASAKTAMDRSSDVIKENTEVLTVVKGKLT